MLISMTIKEAAKAIGTLAAEQIFSTEFNSLYEKLISKRRLFILKNKVVKWCEKFFKEHDGSVLTESRFLTFLSNYKVIEEIFSYTQESINRVSEETFISSLVRKTKNGIKGRISPCDESVIREFYKNLLSKFTQFELSKLSVAERQIVHQNTIQNAKTIDALNNLDYTIQKKLLQNSHHISEKEIVEIYNTLNALFWNGKFDVLINLIPLVKGKSNELEVWLQIVLSMSLSYDANVVGDLDYNKISCKQLKDDIVRKDILFSYLGQHSVKYVPESKEDILFLLIRDISNSKDGNFYDTTVEQKNSTSLIKIQIPKKYETEEWLVKRLLSVYLLRQTVKNVDSLLYELFGKETDFLVKIINANQKIRYRINARNKKAIEEAQNLFDEVWEEREVYVKANVNVQKLFFNTCFNWALYKRKDLLLDIINEVPEETKHNVDIQELILLVDIELNRAQYVDILNFCKKNKRYVVMSDYLISLEDSHTIINMVKENLKEFLESPRLFFIYVRALRAEKKLSEAIGLLKEKQPIYEEYEEYWIERYLLTYEQQDLSYLEKAWLANKVKKVFGGTDEEVIEIIFNNNRLETCIQMVQALETRDIASTKMLKLKISAYLQLGNKYEAFKALKIMFEEENRDTFVVYNYVILSLELKRDVNQDVENALYLLDTSYSYLLLAKLAEQKENVDIARSLYLKSLIMNQGENDLIYGNYFNFSITEGRSEEEKIKGITENTVAYMQQENSKKIKIYAICPKELLPKEMYEWNDALFISKERAIQKDLLRKKVSEIISVDENEYKIIDIIPFECYLVRTCISKMRDMGQLKACQLPIDGEKEQAAGIFMKWLKENINESKQNDVLASYRDFDEVPLSLYAISKFSRGSYQEVVAAILEDKSFVVREDYNFGVPAKLDYESSFVLSYAAAELLFILSVDVNIFSNANVYIPKSLITELKEEKEQIIKEYDRETVASLSMIEGKFYLNEANEDTKNKQMEFSVNFLEYCEQLPQLEGTDNVVIKQISEDNILKLIGVVDYDAISICKEKGFILVSLEMLLTQLVFLSELPIKVCNILEFLDRKIYSCAELLTYMNKLVDYRIINVINANILLKIAHSEESGVDQLWMTFLQTIDNTEGDYRKILANELGIIGRNAIEREENVDGKRISMFVQLVMKINSIKVKYKLNGNKIEFITYREPYEVIDQGESEL